MGSTKVDNVPPERGGGSILRCRGSMWKENCVDGKTVNIIATGNIQLGDKNEMNIRYDCHCCGYSDITGSCPIQETNENGLWLEILNRNFLQDQRFENGRSRTATRLHHKDDPTVQLGVYHRTENGHELMDPRKVTDLKVQVKSVEWEPLGGGGGGGVGVGEGEGSERGVGGGGGRGRREGEGRDGRGRARGRRTAGGGGGGGGGGGENRREGRTATDYCVYEDAPKFPEHGKWLFPVRLFGPSAKFRFEFSLLQMRVEKDITGLPGGHQVKWEEIAVTSVVMQNKPAVVKRRNHHNHHKSSKIWEVLVPAL